MVGGADQQFLSAGQLPSFSPHGADLETPGMLAKVVAQVAYRSELILVCGDAKPTASSANGLNTVLALRALQLHHILYLSDSAASCAALRGAMPDVACVWSSRISATKPRDGGLCVQLYWGYAFYFYDLRKHYLARMTMELGINVLQTDTDVVWLGNPYPALKGVFGQQQIVAMFDRPMVNAGVFYAQGVRDGDGAGWVLRELADRIHMFLLRPSAVKEHVPWAQPPYFANVDEQTLMNDCVRSSIANVTSFAQATAGWEVKKHRTGTVMNKSFHWKATAEYRLVKWLDREVPEKGRRARLPSAVRLHDLCGSPSFSSPGTVFPLHAVGSAAAPRATLAVAPQWLFMHLPSKIAAGAIQHCHTVANRSGAKDALIAPAAPFIMGHLAGVRSGAWSRRALVRAYGWWHPEADLLIARQLGWGRRARTLSLAHTTEDAFAMLGTVVRSQASFDLLVGNLLLLGGVLGRRAIIPEIPCGLFPGVGGKRGYGTRPVAARWDAGTQRCAWMPPKACWATEYVTQLEAEREAQAGRGVERPADASSAASGTPRLRRLAQQASRRKPLSAKRNSSECDQAARLLTHALVPSFARVSPLAPSGVGQTRNASAILALRRRLREMPCDASPNLHVLPTMREIAQNPPLQQSSSGLARNRTSSRARQRIHLLELLVRAPLSRHPKLQGQVLRTLSNASSLLHADAVSADRACIEALFQQGGAPARAMGA